MDACLAHLTTIFSAAAFQHGLVVVLGGGGGRIVIMEEAYSPVPRERKVGRVVDVVVVVVDGGGGGILILRLQCYCFLIME